MTGQSHFKICHFLYHNTTIFFLFFISCYFMISLMNALIHANKDQCIQWGKIMQEINEKYIGIYFVYCI